MNSQTEGRREDAINRLKMIKNITGIITRQKGDVIDYTPWYHQWHRMDETQRVDKGIFIHCYGHGEFEVLYERVDVEITNQELTQLV